MYISLTQRDRWFITDIEQSLFINITSHHKYIYIYIYVCVCVCVCVGVGGRKCLISWFTFHYSDSLDISCK